MSKFAKLESDDHAARLRDDTNRGELLLVRGGKLAYINAITDHSGMLITFSGPQKLRKLAKAILAEVPDCTRKRKS